jgi:hypothetical protein
MRPTIGVVISQATVRNGEEDIGYFERSYTLFYKISQKPFDMRNVTGYNLS